MRLKHTLKIELIRLTAVVGAIFLTTVVVLTQSQAAFSDTTANTTNSFASGSVIITDDDLGTAMFAATGMSNGNPVTECIALTYSGSLTPADIRMYGTSSGVLDDYLDLTIEVGTGGGFGSCGGFGSPTTIYSGTLDNFSATRTNWADGLAVFTANTNPTSVTLRFTVDVQDDPAAQAQSASAGFTFEAQDT